MQKLTLYKILNVLLLIVGYLAAILTEEGFAAKSSAPEGSNAGNGLIIAGLVFYAILFMLQIPSYIITCLNSGMSEQSVAKHNMIMKIINLPFFAINVYSCAIVVLEGLSISFLLLPFLISFLVVNTYLVMFRTSLSSIIYFIKKYINQKLKPSPWSIIAIIFSFIFCLDAVGAIILFKHELNQIDNRYYKKIMRKVERWKNKTYMPLSIYKILSIVSSIGLYAGSIILVVTTFVNYEEVSGLENISELIIPALGVLFFGSLFKIIIGIIYGINGEENPINFLSISKLFDALPIMGVWTVSCLYMIIGIAFSIFSVLLIFLIVVIVVFFVIFAFNLISGMLYFASASLFIIAALCFLGNSVAVFTYYMNQRKVKNRKFKNKAIVLCMFLLWIPVISIPATFVLRGINKTDGVLGDEPLATLKE